MQVEVPLVPRTIFDVSEEQVEALKRGESVVVIEESLMKFRAIVGELLILEPYYILAIVEGYNTYNEYRIKKVL